MRPRETARALRGISRGMRSISRNPDRTTMVCETKRPDGWYQCRKEHWANTIKVPVVPPTAVVPYPQVVQILFEDGDPQRPFIYWPFEGRGTTPDEPFINFYTNWLRLGARVSSWFFLQELDETGNSATGIWMAGAYVPQVDRPTAQIIRSVQETLHIADGSNLVARNDETGNVTTTDLGGEIYTLTATASGRTYAITQGDGFSGGGNSGDAYDAGFDYSFTDDNAYFYGLDACEFSYGYDPDYDYEEFYLIYDAPEVPSEFADGGELEQAWFDGLYAGFLISYDEGYADGGCGEGGEE